MHELIDALIQALERGEQVALITSVRTVGSTPRHSAARLAVFPNGETVGTIGGGTMELQAVADARAALAENRPRLVEYNLIGRGEGNVGLCGGTQEVFIDILKPSLQVKATWSGIRAALESGEAAVLAEVVRSTGAELDTGMTLLVRPSSVAGSMGALQDHVVNEARRVMAEHYPLRLGYDPETGAVKRLVSTRRAPVEVFMDLYDPRPRLVIIGAGHIGAALARQANFLGWEVQVVDDRPDFLTMENLPSADATHLVKYEPERERLGPLVAPITPNTAVVVATWGWDEPALRQLAGVPAFYVGLVASLRKAAFIFETLREEGVDAGWLDNVRVPVGLDVGAESPEEIALAIMAEILTVSRGKSGRPLREIRGDRLAALHAHPAASHA